MSDEIARPLIVTGTWGFAAMQIATVAELIRCSRLRLSPLICPAKKASRVSERGRHRQGAEGALS